MSCCQPAAGGLFWAGPVVQGPGVDWQHPASLVGFDPTLLICEKKRGVEPPRRSCPKEPLGRGSSGLLPKQRGCSPSDSPGLPGTEIFPVGRGYVLLSALWSGVRQIWKTRLGAKQISSGNFFARGLLFPTAMGTPSPPQSPPQGFLQSKNALRRRKTVSSLLGSLIVVRTANQFAIAIQKESAGKKCRSARQDSSCQLEPLGSHKGPQTLVLCCAASATKAISSRRLDTALLCAAKKRGVEKNQLAGLCQNHTGPLTTGPVKNLPWRPAGAKIPRFPGGTLNASHAETPDSGLRPFGYRRHDRRCSIARAGSDTKNSAFRCIRQARTHSPAGFPDRIPHSRSAD